ncbi:MAG TPA: hypothetical protein VK190_02470 [Pseudoneobacillus sp.]|nr:hypothetical protein [Pseudoneobacillus sp.]
MAYYDSINCTYGSKTDVEHYVKCIYILQDIDGSEEIIDMLKEKVIEIFKDVPVKNGYKTMDSYRYYPNGLIEPARAQGYCQILVDEWSTEKVAKIKEKKKTYKELKQFDKFWYYQFKEYLDLSYKIKYDYYEEFKGEINLQVIKEKLAKYNTLDEEGKKFFNEERMEYEYEYILKKIYNILCRNCRCNIYLGEEQLKFIKEIYDTHTDQWFNNGQFYRTLNKIKDSMKDSNVNITNGVNKYWLHDKRDNKEIEDFLDRMKKIEEPTVQKVLKRLGVE